MLKRLASCIGEYKKYAILTPLIMVGEVVIECLIPFIIAQIVDSLKKGVALSEIMKSGVLLFFMAIPLDSSARPSLIPVFSTSILPSSRIV